MTVSLESPRPADRLITLGNAHEDRGAFDAALASYRAAVETAPDYPRAHLNLASALEHVGRTDDAIASLRQALALDPSYLAGRYNLGKLLAAHRRHDEAEIELRAALHLDPACIDAAIVLASVCEAKGDTSEAEVQLRYAATHGAGSAGASYNLALMLSAQGRLDEAALAYEEVLKLDPDFVDAYVCLANLLQRTRRAREGEPLLRKALSISPLYWDALSNLLFSMNVRDDLSPNAIYLEHLRVAQTLERGIVETRAPPRTAPHHRRLKIGYVSGDLGPHPVALFLRPALLNQDRDQFESFCYSNNRPDDSTGGIRSVSDHWRDITLLDDDQAAVLIRADAIDILVDLSGYTGGSRLPVFIRRPAPVQVSWLGYLNTTGLKCMQYRISDYYADPVGISEHLHTETLFRLPHSQWCYQPVYEAPLLDYRRDKSASITFGSFNQVAKISDSCVALWCDVLRHVPGSQLRIFSMPSKATERDVLRAVESHGIDPSRVKATPRIGYPEYFAAISDVDIALDTFPYNGATTTLDTLWTGVPIVALLGDTSVARSSVSILSSLGATDLIATSPSDYIAINVALANDAAWRWTLRDTLRSRLERSPLMDARGFTRDLEAGFRTMWRDNANGRR